MMLDPSMGEVIASFVLLALRIVLFVALSLVVWVAIIFCALVDVIANTNLLRRVRGLSRWARWL